MSDAPRSTTHRGADDRPRRAWLQPTVLAAAVLAAMSGYGQFGVTAVLGDVATAFGRAEPGASPLARVGLSATTLGVGLAVVRLAGMASLPAASLADRHGRRIVVHYATAGLVLTVLAAATPSFWTFVAVVALARPLLSATNAVATVVAAEETDTADRAKAIAVAEVGYALGSGAVAIVHGIGSAVLGFRGVLALGGLLLAPVPWLLRRGRETRRFVAAPPGPAGLRRLGAVRRGLRGRMVVVSVLAAVMALITGPGFTFVFVYGEAVLGVAPATMTGLVLGAGVLGFPALLLGRWAADRLGRRPTAAAATVLTAVSAIVTYSGTVVGLAVGYAAGVAFAAAFGPATGALFAEVFPTRDRSTAGGWIAAAGVLGAVAGLALFGLLIEALGGFLRAAAVLWLPALPLLTLYATLPETRHRELEAVDREP